MDNKMISGWDLDEPVLPYELLLKKYTEGTRQIIVVSRNPIGSRSLLDDTHRMSVAIVRRSNGSCQSGIGIQAAYQEIGCTGILFHVTEDG